MRAITAAILLAAAITSARAQQPAKVPPAPVPVAAPSVDELRIAHDACSGHVAQRTTVKGRPKVLYAPGWESCETIDAALPPAATAAQADKDAQASVSAVAKRLPVKP